MIDAHFTTSMIKGNLEKVYFRSQILECPSIGQYWNIFGVLVLHENSWKCDPYVP